jgi:hypothetical protein
VVAGVALPLDDLHGLRAAGGQRVQLAAAEHEVDEQPAVVHAGPGGDVRAAVEQLVEHGLVGQLDPHEGQLVRVDGRRGRRVRHGGEGGQQERDGEPEAAVLHE